MPTFTTIREFLDSVRTGKYTSVGCYPKYWLMRDGETLSYEAVRENIFAIARAMRDHNDAQWECVGCDVNWEDPDMYCAHTNARIESAYAEDAHTDSDQS